MNDIAVNADHLLDLAEAVCSKDASKADLLKLKSLLLSNPAACRRYLLYCEMQAALRFEVRADRAAQKVCQEIDIKSVPHAAPESGISEIGAPVNSYSTFLSTAYHGAIGYFSHEIPFSFLIGAVLTGLLMLVAWLVPVSSLSPTAENTSPIPFVNQQQFASDRTLELMGRITGMVDVKWSDISTSTETGNGVLLGRKYTLASGLMEITYDTGAKVILQGPCEYQADSRNGGFLSVGKLTARLEKKEKVPSSRWLVASESNLKSRNPEIPKSPISNPQSAINNPFTIRTPTANVTDLGTEFGVEVDPLGQTDARVFVGAVRLTTNSQNTSNDGQYLSAGQCAHVSSDRLILKDDYARSGGENRFVRSMPTATYKSRSQSYGDLVLSMKPAVYCRMEQPKDEKERRVVSNIAPRGINGVVHLKGEFDQPYRFGRFGDSLNLRGKEFCDYVIIPDYPKAKDSKISASAWVILRSPALSEWEIIAANWGHIGGQFHLGVCQDGDLAVQIGQGEDSHRHIELREGSSTPFPLDKWQHVAFVADGAAVRLYRNGIQVASMPCPEVIPSNPPMQSIGVGCKTDDTGRNPNETIPAYWRGLIDEFVIFNRALSSEEVQQLFKGIPATSRRR